MKVIVLVMYVYCDIDSNSLRCMVLPLELRESSGLDKQKTARLLTQPALGATSGQLLHSVASSSMYCFNLRALKDYAHAHHMHIHVVHVEFTF